MNGKTDAAFLGDMALRMAAGPMRGHLWAQSLQKLVMNHIEEGRRAMPRGDKGSYTDKQKRQAEHIEEGYEKKGVSKKEAEARAWATVNKETGGGKKSGSGRGKKTTRTASRKGGKKGGKKAAKKSGRKTSKKK